jgi:hypothetical protein
MRFWWVGHVSGVYYPMVGSKGLALVRVLVIKKKKNRASLFENQASSFENVDGRYQYWFPAKNIIYIYIYIKF